MRVRVPAFLLAIAIATSSVIFASPGRGLVGEVQQYEVMRGDTLSLVAARFGLDTSVLAKDNGLKSNARLKPGDVRRAAASISHHVRKSQRFRRS